MKYLYLLTFAASLFAIGNISAQNCIPANITLLTQSDVDNFQTTYGTCDTITGNLRIGNGASSTNITSLAPLSGLKSVGSLFITDNDQLESLNGLHNIIKDNVSKLSITDNLILSDISQLSGFGPRGGDIGIADNPALPNLIGLQSLRTLGTSLTVRNNDLITNLNPLSGISRIDRALAIQHNDALTDISGLSNIVLFGSGANPVFIIEDNVQLEDCTPLCFVIQRILPLLNNLTKDIQNNLNECVDEVAILNACIETNNGIYSGSGLVPMGTEVAMEEAIQFDTSTFLIDGINNKVGIGTITPMATLEVDGTVRLSSLPTSGTISTIIAVDASGNAFEYDISNYDSDASDDFSGSWNDLSGVPTDIVDGDDNTQLTDAQITSLGYIKSADDADADPTNELYNDSELRDSFSVHRIDITNLESRALNSSVYDNDGTLSGNRAIDLGGNILNFDANTLSINGNTHKVGIGTSTPTYELDIIGDVGISGAIYGLSDARLKKNKTSITDALSILTQLKPITYNFDQTQYPLLNLPEEKQYGLIAQELEKVLPELVSNMPGAENGNFKSINYNGLIALLIAAINEQQVKIELFLESRRAQNN